MGIFISNGGMGSQVGGVSAPIPTAGLLLYLNPNEGVDLVSGAVANWFDGVSPDPKVASQHIDVARRPTIADSLVLFDGTNDILIALSGALTSSKLHIFIAAKTTSAAKPHTFIRKSANIQGASASTQFEWTFGPRAATSTTDRRMEFRVTDLSGTPSTFASADATPNNQLFLAEAELGSAGSFTYRENGVSKGIATLIEIPSGKDPQNAILIGGVNTATDSNNRWLAGSIGLIAVYAEPQTKAVVNSVYQHFRDVHGLSITDRP